MKKYIQFAFGVLLSIISNNSFSQTSPELTSYANYNHENKLRFEWPVINKRKCCNSILEIKEYANLIVNNLGKIEAGIKVNEPAIIRISKNAGIGKIEIDRSIQSITYYMKDSQQIFVGFHQIKILTDNQQEIRIFFDEIKNLEELTQLNFDTIYTAIFNNFKKERSLNHLKTREFVYFKTKNENKPLYSGKINRDKSIAYGGSFSIGSLVGFNPLGFGTNMELYRIKYVKNNLNLNSLSSKKSIQMKSYGFQSGSMNSYGINLLGANNSNFGFELIGFGAGYFNYRDYNTGLVSDGIYYSFISESKRFFISLDLNIAFRNSENFSINTLTLGIKLF